MLRRVLVVVFAALACFVSLAEGTAGEDLPARGRTAPDLLPATTAVYAEIPQPAHVLDLLRDHPVHQRLQGLDDYQKAFQTPQYQQFLLAVKVFEGAVDMRWLPAVKLLTAGGLYLGADPQTQGMAVLIHSGDGQKLAAVLEAALTAVRTQAEQQGQDDPIQRGEYRGITAYRINEVRFAQVEDWLIVTNKNELGKSILDRFLDPDDPAADEDTSSLAQTTQFQEARRSKPEHAAAWAYADLAALREAGAAGKFFAGPRDNPLGELLIGGLTAMAQKAPFATLAVEASLEHFRLAAAMPFDPASLDETRLYYFGPEGQGAAPPLATASQPVFQLSVYRDLAEFWASAPDLFNEDISAKFAEADGNLTTLFSGRDFGDEVLNSVHPEIQIVVARQNLPQPELPAPDIKLPAFAAVFRLKDNGDTNMRRHLKVSVQSLMGFLNVVGAMNGQPPLEQNVERRDDAEILSGKYLPPAPGDDPPRGLINYNFSPTVAFAGDRLVIASSYDLGVELAAAKAPPAPDAAAEIANARAKFTPGALRAVLEDNREQLIAQNMLEKGHSREQAEKEIGAIFELLTWFRSAALSLTQNDGMLRLEWSVAFAPAKADAQP